MLFVVILIILLNYANSQYEEVLILPNTKQIVKQQQPPPVLVKFENEITKCPMFSKLCKIKLFISNDLNKSDISIKYNLNTTKETQYHNKKNKKLFEYKAFEICEKNIYENKNSKDNNKEFSSQYKCDSYNESNSLNTSFSVAYIYIEAILVGRSSLIVVYGDNSTQSFQVQHDVIISSPERLLDSILMGYVYVFQTVISTFMGLLLDVHVLLKIMKMPIPALIGLFSQYICMPVLSFACIKLFSIPPVEGFAIFIYGCSPGGAASNNWTIMLDGDIDLSAIMTFVSTVCSLVFMPGWIYSLGRLFSSASDIYIPFLKLFLNLLNTIAPCLFGLCLAKCFPKLKPIIMKIAKPLILFALLSFLIMTLGVKYYVFFLVEWKQWFVGPFIPWLGFFIGGFVAWLFRLPKKQIYTIAIETGIQNAAVAFLIVFHNFPSPEADFAILPLVAITSLTTIPLWGALFLKIGIEKIKAYKHKKVEKTTQNKVVIAVFEPNEQTKFKIDGNSNSNSNSTAGVSSELTTNQ